MTAPAAPTPAPWSLRRTILCAALLVAAVEAALLFAGNGGVLHGSLIDPDCYMHLQRAYRLMKGGWQPGGFDPRVNAPFGFAIHWTSLFDGLLVAGAWPLTLAGTAPRAALYLWGSLVSPLLLMLSLGVYALGVRRWVSGPSFIWLTVLVFTQPQFSGAFLAGRVDHHSLILGLMLIQLAWLYGFCSGSVLPRWLALAAGVAAGMQLCTTIEALLTILFMSFALAVLWLGFARDTLRLLMLYWMGALVTVLGWVAFTRGSFFFQPLYDRVSVVHVAVLASGFAGIVVMELSSRRLPRLATLAIGGTIAVALVALTYPDFFLGPWPNLDPAVKAWHREIGELQPLLPDSWAHLAAFLGQMAAVVVALPFAFRWLRHGDSATRQAMLVSLCGCALFGVLALAQMRWSGEVQAAMLLPWTLASQRIMNSRLAISVGKSSLPLRSPMLMAALLLQILPQILVSPPGRVPATAANCSWFDATRALAAMPDQHGVVMTELWWGPEIIWGTGFDVVGAPYEIAPALADTARFQTGSAADARAVLEKRRARYVLTCGAGRAASVAGLEPVAFSAPGFHLYRVSR